MADQSGSSQRRRWIAGEGGGLGGTDDRVPPGGAKRPICPDTVGVTAGYQLTFCDGGI